MINFLSFMLFSTIELATVFVLSLALFRLRIAPYLREILSSSAVITFIAYLLEIAGYHTIAVILQIICVFLSFWLLCKEKLVTSFLFSIIGYMFYCAVQLLFVAILSLNKLTTFDEIGDPFAFKSHIFQSSNILIVALIILIMRHTGFGFGFIQDIRLFKREIKTTNKLFLTISSISLILFCYGCYIFFANKDAYYFILFLLISLIVNIILIYLYIRRDREQYGNQITNNSRTRKM